MGSHSKVNDKLAHHAGPNCFAVFALEDVPEFVELTSKLVFCFSPAACCNNLCLDLAPANTYNGHVMAAHCQTYSIKVAVELVYQLLTQFDSSSCLL
jgi:hypothetical protein